MKISEISTVILKWRNLRFFSAQCGKMVALLLHNKIYFVISISFVQTLIFNLSKKTWEWISEVSTLCDNEIQAVLRNEVKAVFPTHSEKKYLHMYYVVLCHTDFTWNQSLTISEFQEISSNSLNVTCLNVDTYIWFLLKISSNILILLEMANSVPQKKDFF